jgi:uncharacterized membrane protein YdjX (TVP38/TMEM64 family)
VETLLESFPDNIGLNSLISIGLNVLIAVTGVLPSTFITIGTISVLGFKTGLIILIVGEAAGAIVSFILYRKGLYKLFSTYPKINNMENKFLKRLRNIDGMEALFTVFLLRILPFVPSGAVTLTATLSKLGFLPFSIASTIGKIPSLIIEAYSVAYFFDLKSEWQIGLTFFIVILFLIYLLWKRKKETNKH